jgi:hypothetical protein
MQASSSVYKTDAIVLQNVELASIAVRSVNTLNRAKKKNSATR